MIQLCSQANSCSIPLSNMTLVAHAKILMFGTNLNTDTVRCSHLPSQTHSKGIDEFPVMVSLWGRVAYFSNEPLCLKLKCRTFYPV